MQVTNCDSIITVRTRNIGYCLLIVFKVTYHNLRAVDRNALIFQTEDKGRRKVMLSLLTGHGGLRAVRHQGSHIFLDNCIADGVKLVGLTPQPPFTPGKIPGTHFCYDSYISNLRNFH